MIHIVKKQTNDSELTLRAAEGQREAFAQIVSRYQSLVCSLAYSATGSVSQSEDIAQETFIAAWKGLRSLREPEKLRSWLCGIARNIIASAVRSRRTDPGLDAEPLDTLSDLHSRESMPEDHAISREEESILWRSIEHIPHMYREPLVLFYREGKSIDSVAQELELSEEAVKQRLSRGRKLLKMEVEAFVESALRQSAPGRRFTSAVLAGLPEFSTAAGASTAGVAALKTAAIKGGFIAAMLAPILGATGGLLSMIGTIRLARSKREQSIWTKATVVILLIFSVTMPVLHHVRDNGRLFLPIFAAQFLATLCTCVIAGILAKHHRQRVQSQTGIVQENTGLPFGRPGMKGFAWAMYGGLFGIVFCHPFPIQAIFAARAGDEVSLYAILAVTLIAAIFCRRVFIRKPEQSLKAMCVVETVYFAFLLALYQFRWEDWTGKSPWQLSADTSISLAVSFLLFAFYVVVLWIKRNR